MKRILFIEQSEPAECGLACLTMILNYYGNHITLPEIREDFTVNNKGLSFKNLIDISKNYHLETYTVKANINYLMQLTEPVILHWNDNHFVILKKLNKKSAIIVDPAEGFQKLKLKEFLSKFTGYTLILRPNENFVKSPKRKKWNFLLQSIFKHKKWIYLVIFTSLIIQFFGILIPMFISNITNKMVDGNRIEHLGLSIILLFAFYCLFTITRGYIISKIQTLVDRSMMSSFIQRLFSLSYKFFQNRTVGDLVFRANSNVVIRQILSTRLVTLVIDFLMLFIYAIIMLVTLWQLGVIVMLLGLIQFTIVLAFTVYTRKLNEKEVAEQAKTQSYISESIQGILDIKILGGESNVYKEWLKRFNEQLKYAEKGNRFKSLQDSLIQGIQLIIPLIVLWIGSFYVTNTDLSVGEIIGFNAIAIAFISPIASLGQAYNQLLLVDTYIKKIYDVVAMEKNQSPLMIVENDEEDTKNYDFQGNIQLKNVYYRYDSFGDYALKNINMNITKGEKIGIVGPSGSGKSTLAKLIINLYTPTKGEIRYDGLLIDVDVDFKKVRNNIGTVLQETRLFHQTVADNIRLFNQNITMEDVVKAAKLANIHDDIMSLPMGYDTIISESGVNLSGGQRQRILIARSLVTSPSILVLDEATSFLDNSSQSIIENNINSLNNTVVIIAHRLSTVRNCDKIFVMNNGEIVEQGTHDELLLKQGLYHELYNYKTNKPVMERI
ncbi:peptidase domain-containing ABC transporter [Aeribacillus sp. FSL K6-1305]|uniref:peptidase domain-containing ABC transporter n=2 Tax=unclassified Aeribacillus TaxID=2640495 RepID=UPI0030FD7032